jgi:hypothetical protein
MYLPTITNGKPARSYLLGPYTAILFTDCESKGFIDYLFILYIFREGDRRPFFAVASEMNRVTARMGLRGRFLGVFPGQGHHNLGLSQDWTDIDKFTRKALQVAAHYLEVLPLTIRIPERTALELTVQN